MFRHQQPVDFCFGPRTRPWPAKCRQPVLHGGADAPGGPAGRVIDWALCEERRGTLIKGSDRVLRAVLTEGEIERGAVPDMLGVGERRVRKITAGLLDLDALSSDSPRARLRLHFPATLAAAWMPNLFPER